jgi:serine/threonine protein phosphatase PrpC/flagellar basal body-associated protein FliL
VDRIGRSTQANGQENEDFFFTTAFGSVQLLVVGDFAQSDYKRIDAATTNALQQLVNDNSVVEAANKPVPLLISQLASKLNGRLLSFAERFKARFQASAIFVALQGTDLYYLPVGDCRLSIYTGNSLILLNGTVWADSYGNPLPMLIEPEQDVSRGTEPPPDQALGVSTDVDLSSDRVKHYTVEQDDAVLLYSDGVDKFLSPVHLLGLLQKHASGASVQSFAEKVIDEVRIEHGNDDRTVVIIAGPHLKEPDPAMVESIQNVQNMAASVAGVSDRISSLENYSRTLHGEVASLRTSIEQVSNQITRLPTLEQMRTNSAGSDGLGESSLKRILDTLTDIQYRVRTLEGSGGAYEDTQSTQKSKQNKKTPAKTPAPQPPDRYNGDAHSETNITQLAELSLNRSVREGVLRVETGFYELVDEGTAVDSDPQKAANCFVPPGPVRPGWLTATYLCIRLRAQSLKEDAPAEAIKAWLQKKIEEAAQETAKLPADALLSLRDRHWKLRDKRRAFLLFRLSDDQLIEEEKMLAMEAFPLASGQASPKAVVKPISRDKKLKVWLLVVVILGSLALGAIVSVVLSSGSNTADNRPQSEQPPPTTRAEPVKLEYGADGRTLFAVQGEKPERIKYRITIGKEQAFRKAISQQQFNSVEDLIREIENKGAEFVTESTGTEGVDIDAIDDTRRVFQVEASDLVNVPASNNEKCTRLFLPRVNRQLPDGVRNSLDNLQELNPGLRCNDLKAGDRLVVKAKR